LKNKTDNEKRKQKKAEIKRAYFNEIVGKKSKNIILKGKKKMKISNL
jgi:hypothetical protein